MDKRSKSKTKKGGKTLNSKIPDDVKEKSYLTRHVDTSIVILDSPEDDIVLESLLFLSKYADFRLINLSYLQQKGLLQKLLNLFNRNICILRLCLRLLNILLSIEDVVFEFDQEIYDQDVLKIADYYIRHKDAHVKEFSGSILIKLANSCKITSLIFSEDLLNHILVTIKTKNVNILKPTITLFDLLLAAPAAISLLPEMNNFDASLIVNYLNHNEREISDKAFKIISKLTLFGLDVYQTIFKNKQLVEKMMEFVMNPSMKHNHNIALQIILNCMNSDITSSYFVESLAFLKFCKWVKDCDAAYLPMCSEIFLRLSSIPSIRQMLFDLSVEESILYFLRSNDKSVLNKTCEAISLMSEHSYCCEHITTGTVIATIFHMLDRVDDEEDPQNEVAIKTLSKLIKRSFKTIQLLDVLEAQQKFVDLFIKGLSTLSLEGYQNVTEIIFHFVVHPTYQETIVNAKLFRELLTVMQSDCETVQNLCAEMITICIINPAYVDMFINLDGPAIVVQQLKRTKNPQLLKNILVLIHSTLTSELLLISFLESGLVKVLKEFSLYIRKNAPIIDTLLSLIFNIYLPLKFFETNRLEITDKLNNKFYLINGCWTEEFPFLEILQCQKMSTVISIYVVDYTYEVMEPKTKSSSISIVSTTTSTSESQNSSQKISEGSSLGSDTSSSLLSIEPGYEINYGELSPDPFLPKYIYHINKLFGDEDNLESRIKILAEYVDTILCGPDKQLTIPQKFHTFRLHLQSLKHKLGTNMIPIGYLRIGFYCERALLFKAIADVTCIPCSLVQNEYQVYWNEVALLVNNDGTDDEKLKFYIVDLMNNVGSLMGVGSREAEKYCTIKSFKKM